MGFRDDADREVAAGAQHDIRILLADGDEQTRSFVASILNQSGYQVDTASTGGVAVELLKLQKFDLVVTDISVEDDAGVSLLDRTRLDFPDLAVVVISSNAIIDVAVDAMRRGAADYLCKPFNSAALLGAVKRTLDRKQVVDAREDYQHSLEHVVRARTEMLLEALQDLEHSYDVTLEALGEALDLRDSETEGHSKRVTAFTIALARAMHVGPSEMKSISRGAYLHDIGKIAIPDNILRKSGPLDRHEREAMREHCARGYHMLRNISFLNETAEIVLSHQEHYDGNGYPRRLKGEEIPLGARIFAVADALDAMTSERPYRKMCSYEEARDEIQRCSGTQFDPAVVKTFLKMPKELWVELRSEINNRHEKYTAVDLGYISALQALRQEK
jgi:putative nucleotidyltransferase with HDIG domain